MKSKKTLIAAALVTAAILFLIVLIGKQPQEERIILMVQDTKTKALLYETDITDTKEFSISFTHSVNKSDVEEFYQVQGSNMVLFRAKYKAFGAGVATAIENKQTLHYENDYMVIEGLHQVINPLSYFIGRVSDQILHVNGQSIYLKNIGTPGQSITFTSKTV